MQKESKNSSTPLVIPKYLFQKEIGPDRAAFFLITDSDKLFWMKQDSTEWEQVAITGREVLREGGSTTYFFNGKKYNKLHISAPLEEDYYIKGDTTSAIGLKKLRLSKEKLEEIGITSQMNLKLSAIQTDSDDMRQTIKTKTKKTKVITNAAAKSLEQITGKKRAAGKTYMRLNSSDCFNACEVSVVNAEAQASSCETLTTQITHLKR